MGGCPEAEGGSRAAALLEQAIGLRSFVPRGKEKVGLEWTLVTTSYNLK